MQRPRFFGCFLFFVALSLQPAFAQNEQAAIDAATKVHEKEIEAARKAYEEAIGRANKKLLGVYDVSIRGAMRRGGGDALDAAGKLNEEKKKIVASMAGTGDAPNASQEQVIALLTGNTWYWHWEQLNKDTPVKFSRDGTIIEKNGVNSNKWTMDRRWVVTINDHQFVPLSETLFRGFNIESGRQVGMTADPKK